jgi:hypothetical protein
LQASSREVNWFHQNNPHEPIMLRAIAWFAFGYYITKKIINVIGSQLVCTEKLSVGRKQYLQISSERDV